MKISKGKLVALVMVTLMLLHANCASGYAWSLFGGNKSARDDAGIREDIQSTDENFGKYQVNLDRMEIEKRKTDKKQGSDDIWIHVVASNDYTIYTASYELIYGLYNDGWLLDDLLTIESHIDARQPIPAEEADEKVAAMGYVSYECIAQSGSAESGRVSFSYSAEKADGQKDNVGVVYTFIPTEGWTFFSAVGMSA